LTSLCIPRSRRDTWDTWYRTENKREIVSLVFRVSRLNIRIGAHLRLAEGDQALVALPLTRNSSGHLARRFGLFLARPRALARCSTLICNQRLGPDIAVQFTIPLAVSAQCPRRWLPAVGFAAGSCPRSPSDLDRGRTPGTPALAPRRLA